MRYNICAISLPVVLNVPCFRISNFVNAKDSKKPCVGEVHCGSTRASETTKQTHKRENDTVTIGARKQSYNGIASYVKCLSSYHERLPRDFRQKMHKTVVNTEVNTCSVEGRVGCVCDMLTYFCSFLFSAILHKQTGYEFLKFGYPTFQLFPVHLGRRHSLLARECTAKLLGLCS
mmetsp:Transcript_4291/g.9644  ORF Transcript_4291/g.9644 Transcript_4291/m.9644 type:complete len:175 (-) Transcript_4291:439-963(-)